MRHGCADARQSSGRCCGRRSCLQQRRVSRTSRSRAPGHRAEHRVQVAQALFQEGLAGLADRDRPGRPRAFPPAVIAEVKAIACELRAQRAVPLSRFSVADVREEAIACGLVEQVSVSTVWRWLDEDALKPWRHRPRPPPRGG